MVVPMGNTKGGKRGLSCGQKLCRRVSGSLLPRLSGPRLWNVRRFPSTAFNFETTKGLFLNKRPPLRSSMVLEMLQLLRGLWGLCVPREEHTLLRGQRGCKQGLGLRCLALVAQYSGEFAGYDVAGWVVGPQRALGLG